MSSKNETVDHVSTKFEIATVVDEAVDAGAEAAEEAVVVVEALTMEVVPAITVGVAEVATGVDARPDPLVAHAHARPQDGVSDHLLVVGLLREMLDRPAPDPLLYAGPAPPLLDVALPPRRPPVGEKGPRPPHVITAEALSRVVIDVRLPALLLLPAKVAPADGDALPPLSADEAYHPVVIEGGSAAFRSHAREAHLVTANVEARLCTRIAGNGNGTEIEGLVALMVDPARNPEGIEAEVAVATVDRMLQALHHPGAAKLS